MPAAMKGDFRELSTARGFWAGSAVSTNQDLSALFVARAVELYLREGGTFAFVMPLAVLSRRQFEGFRKGTWTGGFGAHTNAAFSTSWDLHEIKPSFFPVPAAVVHGKRAETATPISSTVETWTGRISGRNPRLADVIQKLERRIDSAGGNPVAERSPYASRFAQGATLVPRLFILVEEDTAGPLGAGAGRTSVRSYRSANEKRPWKDLPTLSGSIEQQFLRPTYVGDSVLPFKVRPPALGVIPWDGSDLATTTGALLDQYPGLAEWWRTAAEQWDRHRTSTSTLSLLDRINYQRGLQNQLPGVQHRVVYSASGMYLAAAYVADPRAVIEHKLYWASVASETEAHYLLAVLNSDALLQLVRPLQARGEHNPRDFDKYVWQMPIPIYDSSNALHTDLASLALAAKHLVDGLELPDQSFQAVRRRIRQALDADGLASSIDSAVTQLLA